MENYGETFKKIRMLKGYTLKETAEGIVTVQYLSKFEKGESNITVNKLNDLLNRILVPWSEFMKIHDSGNVDVMENMALRVSKLIYARKYYELDKIADDYEAAYKEYGNVKDLHTSAIIRASYYTIIERELPDEMIESIHQHLNKVDQWFFYENFMFGSFIRGFSKEDIMRYYRRSIKNVNKHDDLSSEIDTIQLVNYVLSGMVNERYLEEAREIIDFSEKYLLVDDNPEALFYKITLRHKIGVLKVLEGNVEEGTKEIDDMAQALESIGGFSHVINSMFLEKERALKEIEEKR